MADCGLSFPCCNPNYSTLNRAGAKFSNSTSRYCLQKNHVLYVHLITHQHDKLSAASHTYISTAIKQGVFRSVIVDVVQIRACVYGEELSLVGGLATLCACSTFTSISPWQVTQTYPKRLHGKELALC